MKLYVNGEIREANFATLGEWVAVEFGNSSTRGFAIAVNDSVVPSSKWNSFSLKENDHILIVEATGGG